MQAVKEKTSLISLKTNYKEYMENVVYRILEGDCITEMAKMFRKDLKNTIIKRDNSVMEIKKIKFNLAKDVLCKCLCCY